MGHTIRTGSLHLAAAKLGQNLDYWLAAQGVNSSKEQFLRLLPDETALLVFDSVSPYVEVAANLAQVKIEEAKWTWKPATPQKKSLSPTAMKRSPVKDNQMLGTSVWITPYVAKSVQKELAKADVEYQGLKNVLQVIAHADCRRVIGMWN